MPIIRATDNKKALLAYKEKILNDIKHYERRIITASPTNTSSINFDASSESDDDWPFAFDNGPMLNELKLQKKMLQTGLHATQELASLTVLQSKVDIMVEDPVLKGESPVLQPGLWREVNADCRIDLVPFSTTFYVHQTDHMFGAKSYRGLKVVPMKPAHEAELSKSVLMRVATPSDAVEVLRSYAVAYRSRRTTLAKLADEYAPNLYMEPMPGGGYLLKCANLLEVSWVLENRWSSVAPFYHKMIFDLENLDECYIKIIRHAHKQLGDPSTDTNERTLLLAKIIATCLEAQKAQDPSESMESDTESVNKIEKRRLTLENEAIEPKKNRKGNNDDEIGDGNARDNINDVENANNIDKQIMAPPKSLPKKVKPKGKENTEHNRKPVKRATVANATNDAKKAKTDINDMENGNNVVQSEIKKKKTVEQSNKCSKDNAKNKDKVGKTQDSTENPCKSTQNSNHLTTNAEAENNHTSNKDNTGKVKSKENEAKSQNTKDKAAVIQNNEKESVKNTQKPTKSNKTAAKSKNHEENPNNNQQNDIQKENASDMQTKRNVNVQDKPKTRVAKETESQKTDKIVVSKNDAIVNPESQKVASKNAVVASSKHGPKATDPNKSKEPSKEKKASSTESIEYNAKKTSGKAKLVEIDDIPIISVNDMNVEKLPRKDNNSNKTVKNQKGASKNNNANKKDPNKNNKQLNSAEPTNMKKKVENKESNVPNVKKSIVSKDKPAHEFIVSNNDNKSQKHNSNKAEVKNTQNGSNNNEKNSENQTKISKYVQKVTKQKLTDKNKELAKEKVKNCVNIENNTENQRAANSKEGTVDNKKISGNHNQQSNEVIKEKVAKLSNDDKSNHIANVKKPNTKLSDGKPKMVIKTLTHKNYASKKVGKFINVSDKSKNVKSGNIAKILIAGNENDSGSKISKIPMKLSVHESLKKKNPLRMSPRRLPSTFKCSSESNMKQKSYFTNIPRLLKKPEPKISK